MRYWYDTEFIEDGRTIDLISIGIVAENGREYYAQSIGVNLEDASEWVVANVLPHLRLCTSSRTLIDWTHHFTLGGRCSRHDCAWRSREQLRAEVLDFINAGESKPELWGYFSAYDHVALCQLFGTMMDLPDGWPMFTRDLQQWRATLGYPDVPEQNESEHHALADARWTRAAWEHLAHIQRAVNG